MLGGKRCGLEQNQRLAQTRLLEYFPTMTAILTRNRADTGPKRMRYTVREYYRMGEAGVFHPDRRCELIDGDIILFPKIAPLDAACHDSLNHALITRLSSHYRLRAQNPVRLDNHSEPQPDFAVLKPRKDGYRTAHPGPGDTLLVIELASTSLAYDIGKKQRAYAKAGIPEYWVVDLTGKQLHVFRKPATIGYANVQVLDDTDEIESTAVKGLRLTVCEMVG
jgi:Uma2 family endonuclease